MTLNSLPPILRMHTISKESLHVPCRPIYIGRYFLNILKIIITYVQATVDKLQVVLFPIIVGWGMNRNVALILYLFGASGSSRRRFKSRSEFSGSVYVF